MKGIFKVGWAVVVMGLLGNLLFRGGADASIDIAELVKDGALIIDTRSADEFAGGHIDGAVNIPYDVIGNVIEKHEPNHARSIIVYCHSGARSAAARKSLMQAGYTHVVNGGGLHHMQRELGQ